MIKHVELFNDGQRRWLYFGRDPERNGSIIDTNEYVVVNNGRAAMLDPGGVQVFPPYVAALSRLIPMGSVDFLVASHQDPDVVSSLPLWLQLCPETRTLVPTPWVTFISHLSDGRLVEGIPDQGMSLPLGGSDDLRLIPAHYLHASGNFSLYDPVAKILFSGDIGAALLPGRDQDVFVADFAHHVQYMEAFHRRWMPSESAKQSWLALVRKLDIELLCPQHGSIFRGPDVAKFLDWFDALEVGNAWNF